jgi:hypothetical protein
MTRVEALAIAAPLLATAAGGLFILAANYLDNRAAAKELKQKQAGVPHKTTDPALSLSDFKSQP